MCRWVSNDRRLRNPTSVWSSVIPWESRVNSCHLLVIFLGHLKVIFRPLEVMTPLINFFIYCFKQMFYQSCNTSKWPKLFRKYHQIKKKWNNILKPLEGQLLQSFQIYILVHGSVTMHPPPPSTYSPPPILFKLWYVQNMKWDVTSKKNGRTLYFDRFYEGIPKPVWN